MPKRSKPLFLEFVNLPWWCSVIASAVCYVSLSYLVPSYLADVANKGTSITHALSGGLSTGIVTIAPFISLLFLFTALLSFIRTLKIKTTYSKTSTTEDLSKLSWLEFEALVGEHYRKQGYQVKQRLEHGADGGIDLHVSTEGENHLIQCKHWRSQKVGIQVLRELYGVLMDSNAVKMIVITTGDFTLEAQKFALNKPFELINGTQLSHQLHKIHKQKDFGNDIANVKINTVSAASQCPICQSNLVLRTAKKGTNAGSQFYGCESFPRCRYTRS